jgi:pimeloyl-ACP methyl ester carboxylesterase
MARDSVKSWDGTRVTFDVRGEGSPVVIVPGAMAPPELYFPLADLLADRHRVVVIERRGYGESEPGPRPHRISRHVEDLFAVIVAQGEPAAVFGHSFGGLTALEAADSDLVRSLTVYEPPYSLLGGPLKPVAERGRQSLAKGRPGEVIRSMLTATQTFPADHEDALEKMAEMFACRAEGVLADLDCVNAVSPDLAKWAKITIPTLLLCGSESTNLDKGGVRALRDVLPHARYEELLGETHFPENWGLVAELILKTTFAQERS